MKFNESGIATVRLSSTFTFASPIAVVLGFPRMENIGIQEGNNLTIMNHDASNHDCWIKYIVIGF